MAADLVVSVEPPRGELDSAAVLRVLTWPVRWAWRRWICWPSPPYPPPEPEQYGPAPITVEALQDLGRKLEVQNAEMMDRIAAAIHAERANTGDVIPLSPEVEAEVVRRRRAV